jgi:hypothetical protein
MRRNSRNEHISAIVEEIRLVGGSVDRIERRNHHFIYWTLGDRRLIQVLSMNGRHTVNNARGDIRRQARMLRDASLLRCCAAI